MKKGNKGDGNFTIDVQLMSNISLPLPQRILYMWVLDYTRNNRTMFVSIDRIATLFGCSERQIRRYIKDLVDAGLVVNQGVYGSVNLRAKTPQEIDMDVRDNDIDVQPKIDTSVQDSDTNVQVNCDTSVQDNDIDVRDTDTSVQPTLTPMSNYLDTDDKLFDTDVQVQHHIPNNLPNKLRSPRAHARGGHDADATRPTKSDVIAYCQQAGLRHINPDAFYDYYEAVDWMTGNTRIRNWQALCRKWDEEDKLKPKPDGRPSEPERPPSYTLDYQMPRDIITNEEDFPF